MEQRINRENTKRDGKPFLIYGLVCPMTLEVKYVGQTIDLNARTRSRTHTGHDEEVHTWLSSLGYLRPYRVILERGINRIVRVRITAARKAGAGAGRSPFGYRDVWLSSCIETKWIKRFRRTVLNRRATQLPTIYDALSNPPLPWDSVDARKTE